MLSKFFVSIAGYFIFSVFNLLGEGLVPYGGNPGVHAVYRGIWAVFDNPAGIAEQSSFEAGISYHTAFLLQELSDKSLAVVVPMGNVGIAALGYQQFGYALYKEQHGSLVYSRTFGGVVNAGIRFDYLTTKFGNDYGATTAVTGSAGLIARVTENVRIGLSVFNPQKVKFSANGTERYPANVLAGASWNFGGLTELGFGISKTSGNKEILQCKLNYMVSKKFLLYAGVANGAESFSFGYAFQFGKMNISMSSGYNFLLGFTPVFSLTFKSKNDE